MSTRLSASVAVIAAVAFGAMRSYSGDQTETIVDPVSEDAVVPVPVIEVGPPSGMTFGLSPEGRLFVCCVCPGSPAAAAQLCPGDMVLGIDRYHFTTPIQAESYLDACSTDPVWITVVRRGRELRLLYGGESADPVVANDPRARSGRSGGIGMRVAGSRPVVIVGVYRGSPADLAGVQPGDQLLAVNDVECSDVTAVTAAITQDPVGEQLRLTIQRDGDKQMITVSPEEGITTYDELPQPLPGWEARRLRCGSDVVRGDGTASAAVVMERGRFDAGLARLQDEVRLLRQELTRTNARLAALQSDSVNE